MTERPTPESYSRPLHQSSASRPATIWPISFAIGIAVTLVGLIVNPEVIAPLGGAITILAASRTGGHERAGSAFCSPNKPLSQSAQRWRPRF